MNTYVLGSLIAASVVLPVVLAWAIAHTYRTTKIVLWILWVLVICAAGGLLSYAGDKTKLLNDLSPWVIWPVFIMNFLMLLDALDSPFEPQRHRKNKLSAPKKAASVKTTSLFKQQPEE